MDWFIKAFIRASLVWFALGTSLGLAMAMHPPWIVYRPAHAHMNVVGFMTMMIFGVGYQLLPRLFGHALKSRALAIAHWWLANAGLAVMITGFALTPHIGTKAAPVTSAGGVMFVLGVFSFVVNLWRTFDAADARERQRRESASGSGKTLPTLE